MKKIFSAFAAVVIAAAAMTSDYGNMSASVYDRSSAGDREYYCIVKFADDPLAKYEYAQQNGIDKFILTEEGQKVYDDLMEYHNDIMLLMSVCLGRSVEKVYDYTAVYNGFSVILSDSEYRQLYDTRDGMGIAEIYESDLYVKTDTVRSYPEMSAGISYTDMTDRILEQTGVSNVDFKGNSTVISVIDGGFDNRHEFLSTMPDGADGRLDSGFIKNISPYLSASSGKGNNFFQNKKIPFRFNYYRHDRDTSETDAANINHGTHVAGIAGGNGTAETDPKYNAKGIAPEAQLLLMGTDMNKACIMAAYDDSAYLGADVVNLSYGISYKPSVSEPFTYEAMLNLGSVGAMICSAAGNSSKIKFTGEDSLMNTDYSSGSTTGGVETALSVGSADNLVVEKKTLTAGGENYIIMSRGTYDISETFSDETMDMEIVPGTGGPEDFEKADVNGKIAVVKRGTITFEEKASNAKEYGAVGIIFCNDDEAEFSVNVACTSLPSCILGADEGERLMKSGETKVTFNSEKKLFSNMRSSISSFSSWGFTENLILKPDITAYGGNIVSSFPDGKYGVQSGTSMSAPQVSGMSALLKEYLKENKEKYGIENDSDYPELMAKLLMSTAVPVYNTEGSAPASPRVQGSGLVNLKNAVDTPVYIYTDSKADNYRPKLSLGDNLEVNSESKSFSAEKFRFHLKNISDSEQTYTLSADLLRDSAENGNLGFNVIPMTESSVRFLSGTNETDTVTVGPGEDIIVNAELELSEGDKNIISETFGNGTFIDGFIYLKSDSAPDLCLPFTGYCGSWDKGDIFEPFVYDEMSRPSLHSSVLGDGNGNFAGINIIRDKMKGEIQSTLPYYSPNGDNILDDISLMLSFKRRCKNIKAELFKGNTSVYTEELSPGEGYADPQKYNAYRLNWDFGDVKDNDLYTLMITAEKPFSENGSEKEIISQQFEIDITDPVISDCRELDINGEKYMLINASDNKGIQGAVMNEDFDYNCCEKGNAAEHYAVLRLPENISDAHAVVYDLAGNSAELTADDMTADKYTLTYDENLYFSTRDQTFRKKIIMKDSKGKDVNYMIHYNPETAYKDGITEITLFMNFSEIASVPVSVGLAGDADLNDVTNLYDVIKVAKYLIWKSNPEGAFGSEFRNFEGTLGAYLADYDKSGTIDLYDAVGIAKTLMPSSK